MRAHSTNVDNKKFRPPFVKNVMHDKKATMNHPFVVSLEADWPTPSWDYEKTDIVVNNDKKLITISYLGDRRPGVALQALKSFKVDIKVTFPEKGEWQIVIVGKTENWDSKVLVE